MSLFYLPFKALRQSPPPFRENQVALHFSRSPSRWDLLLDLGDYKTPPFYFGFDMEAPPIKQNLSPTQLQKTPALSALQKQIAAEKEKLNIFRGHIRALEKEVRGLSEAEEYNQGKQVVDLLRTHLNTLFLLPSKTENINKLKQETFTICLSAVNDAHHHFKINNKRSLSNVLVNIGLFIAGLGIAYLIASGLHYHATGRFTFFNKPALNNALPAFSQELKKLYQNSGLAQVKATPQKTPSPPSEDLLAAKAWSKIRI